MDGNRPVNGVAVAAAGRTAAGGVQDDRFQPKLDHLDSEKPLPTFGQYIIEGVEGSGGYGTVYRARRKTDGRTFAIKYPHPKAVTDHVHNEREILERFGGMNFVIKYEGSCKSNDTECIVLQYVEHDRRKVLKSLNIFEIQWYAYCMFTALSRLHKLGVVHRDVKPANFLFSRETCTGYLTDFNLAMTTHPKQADTGKIVRKKRKNMEETEAHGEAGSKKKKRERVTEPLPCKGRKELVHLAQESMQSHKQQVHGPCYGTRGFRAPEVLLESIHQGPELDVWSAGVTLLYLLTARSPFTGDPQQNIKEIATLRGSEQIVELAMLHKRRDSLPLDLGFLGPMELKEWCKTNTRRPDFVESIPRSLFDLVDACLAVNPSSRISAKEALKHDSLDPCVKAIRKARLIRSQN